MVTGCSKPKAGRRPYASSRSREKIDLLMTDVVIRPERTDVAEASGPEPGLQITLPERLHRRYGGSLGHLHAEVDFLKKPFTLDVLANAMSCRRQAI